MTEIRESYTREFKIKALHLADTSGKTKAQVERENTILRQERDTRSVKKAIAVLTPKPQ